jgi:glycerol-3-phosphate dehydrogenase
MDTASNPPLLSREERRASLATGPHDVLVVGGGITGAGVALDLVARGLKVALVERGDWAQATSSASSRLIHGGLRYLEQFEFGLVRESCLERALLLRNAAGLVWPEQFVFPVRRGDRVGRAKLLAGMALYTALSMPRALGWPSLLSAAEVERRLPGVERRGLRGGGSYLDGATDDSRLCWATVRTALELGAVCLSRCELLGLEDGRSGVAANLHDRESGERFELRASAAVLCGGPFTDALRARAGLGGRWIAPTRGSHLLVPRERLPTDGAVILPSPIDGRVMFLIPWPRYTAIGTTDLDQAPDLPAAPTRAEVHYLLDSANGLVPAAELTEADVVSTWSGLRPLLAADEASPSARSREERVARDGHRYTLAGGKLTGFRAMAEHLGQRLVADLGRGRGGAVSPTRTLRLHGALAERARRPAWSRALPTDGEAREAALVRRYGIHAAAVRAASAGSAALDPETCLGDADWAVAQEDCLTLCDFLFRRTDVGYGARAAVEALAPGVLVRLGERLGWDAERRASERADLERELQRLHGWRPAWR